MATNLGATDRNDDSDIYLHDVTTGATTLVSATARGEAADGGPPSGVVGRRTARRLSVGRVEFWIRPGTPPRRKTRISCRTSTSPTEHAVRHTISGGSGPTRRHRSWPQRSTNRPSSCSRRPSPSSTEVTSDFNLFEHLLLGRGADTYEEEPVPRLLTDGLATDTGVKTPRDPSAVLPARACQVISPHWALAVWVRSISRATHVCRARSRSRFSPRITFSRRGATIDPARAKILSSLTHPHIVTIHELDREGDIDFIVMELVHGASLDALITAAGLRPGELLVLRSRRPTPSLRRTHGASSTVISTRPAS